MFTLDDRVALVTGASTGLGAAIAIALSDAGASVACHGNTHSPQATCEKIKHSLPLTGDLSHAETPRNLVQQTIDHFGRLDILINNAGIGLFAPVEEMSGDDFRAVIETNLCGVFYCCHEAIPLMKQRGSGYIINVSSLAGANPHANMAAYNASKFGLNGFTEALMQEVRHDNIKVSYIMPGSVNTEFGGDEPSVEKSWQLQPDDIAQVVMDLLNFPQRALPSRVEIRPSRPPKK